MHILRKLATAILGVALFVPSISNAAVAMPYLDIQLFEGDSGAILTNTGSGYDFDIDATAIAIVTSDSSIDIANQAFSLHGTYDAASDYFTGSFEVAGGLLTGTFDNLYLSVLPGSGSIDFATDLTYTSGSLMDGLEVGRLEGIGSDSNLAAKLGPVTVVPVPAAVWLFGSGLIGLVGIARRKA